MIWHQQTRPEELLQIAKDHKEKGRGSHSLAFCLLSGILCCYNGAGNFTRLLLVLFQYFSKSLVLYHYWQRLVERSIFTGPPYRGLYLPAGDELLPRTEMSSPLTQSRRVQKITSVLRQAGVNINNTGTASQIWSSTNSVSKLLRFSTRSTVGNSYSPTISIASPNNCPIVGSTLTWRRLFYHFCKNQLIRQDNQIKIIFPRVEESWKRFVLVF